MAETTIVKKRIGELPVHHITVKIKLLLSNVWDQTGKESRRVQ